MTAGPSGVNETLSERCFRPFASKTRESAPKGLPVGEELNRSQPPLQLEDLHAGGECLKAKKKAQRPVGRYASKSELAAEIS